MGDGGHGCSLSVPPFFVARSRLACVVRRTPRRAATAWATRLRETRSGRARHHGCRRERACLASLHDVPSDPRAGRRRGVAGLEAVLALQALAGDRVEIELLAPGAPLHLPPARRRRAVPRRQRAASAAGSDRRRPRRASCTATGSRDVLPGERAVETQGGARLRIRRARARAGRAAGRGHPRRADLPRAAGRGSRRRGRPAVARRCDPPRGLRRAGRDHLGAAALRARAPDGGRRARGRSERRSDPRDARARAAGRLRRRVRRRDRRTAGRSGHRVAHRDRGGAVQRRTALARARARSRSNA